MASMRDDTNTQQSWACSAVSRIDLPPDIYQHFDLAVHSCMLERAHFGPHQCWCEYSFPRITFSSKLAPKWSR